MKRIAASIVGLFAIVSVGAQQHPYREIRVEAPFEMPVIREYNFPQQEFDITDYGAVANDSTFSNTMTIARAIKACHEAGGGRVVVPEGTWYTGPIHLKSNVCLHLMEGAVLRFSDHPHEFLPAVPTSWEGMECYNYSPLVYAYGCENIGITGSGMLAPEMDLWSKWFARPKAHMEALKQLYTWASTDVPVEQRQMAVDDNNLRPHLIHLNRCKNIVLDGFKIRESPFWTIHLYHCDNGVARNLDVKAHGHNNDGIDLEMTSNFLVEHCTFDQGDDAVVIKSGRNRDAWRVAKPTENIVIRHCKVLKGHTLLGIGSELSGGIRNVYMHDCEVPASVNCLFFIKTNHRRGGVVENIWLKDVTCSKTEYLFGIDMDVLYQWRGLVPTYEVRPTRIRHIHVDNVTCDEADFVYELHGDPQQPPTDITVQNVTLKKASRLPDQRNNVQQFTEKNLQRLEYASDGPLERRKRYR